MTGKPHANRYKKILPSAAVLFLCGVLLYAEEDSLTVEIEPFFTVYGVNVSELVLAENAGKSSSDAPSGYGLLSRLDWRVAPAWTVGVRWHFFLRGFSLVFSTGMEIPSYFGEMEDSDWLGSGGRLTNYSWHENSLRKSISASAAFGYRFPLAGGRLDLTPALRISYDSVMFKAKEGYLQYAYGEQWSSDIPKTEVSGDVVSYTLMTTSLGLALDARWRQTERIAFVAGLSLYPYVRADAVDFHFRREIEYEDSDMGGAFVFAVSGFAGAEFLVSPAFTVTLRCFASKLPVGLGESFAAYDGEKRRLDTDGGVSGWSAGVSVGARFRVVSVPWIFP